MKTLIALLLMCGLTFAEDKPINKEYSYRAFPYHKLSFKDRPASEFNNTIIIGSCFYQENLKDDKSVVKDIFPDGMIGVTFQKCNLDNIRIPVGNIVENSNTNVLIKNDEDGDAAVYDKDNKKVSKLISITKEQKDANKISNMSVTP